MVTFALTTKSIGSCSRDPIPDSTLYRYCFSNPFRYVDWSGNMGVVLVAPVVVVGGGVVITAAELAAAAFSLGLIECLAVPACRAAVEKAIEDAVNGLSAAAIASLRAACRATHFAYKQLENKCQRCKLGPPDTCWEQIAYCTHSLKNLVCHESVWGLRLGYILSGCDIVIPPRDADHWGALVQTANRIQRCKDSINNNCFGSWVVF